LERGHRAGRGVAGSLVNALTARGVPERLHDSWRRAARCARGPPPRNGAFTRPRLVDGIIPDPGTAGTPRTHSPYRQRHLRAEPNARKT
jgi:hypothetical protein